MLQTIKIRNDKIKIKRIFKLLRKRISITIRDNSGEIDMKLLNFVILLTICVTFGAETVRGKSQSKQEERKVDWWQSANVRLKFSVA